MDNSLLLLHKNAQNNAPVLASEDNFPFFLHLWLQRLDAIFARVSTTLSAGLRASGLIPCLSSKGCEK